MVERFGRLALSGLLVLGACGDDGPGDPDGGGGMCAVAVDCDDGVFCNGAETCDPSDATADARGCVSTGAACMPSQTCDEDADECLSDCDAEADADEDGHDAIRCGGDDCDDADSNRFPGNDEVCDTDDHDEDCDPRTYGFRDMDGDSAPDALCCNVDGAERICGTDCDDANPSTHPTESETCDTIDNDCDGMVDEGVQRMFHPDVDGDGFGDETATPVSACTPPADMVENGTDCDDSVATVSPSGTESCNEIDDDCDDMTDEDVCVACPAGYTGVDGECIDINECGDVDRCGRTLENGSVNGCSNSPGSYTCTCGTGFELMGADFDATCVDTDECMLPTSPCDDDPVASCDNATGDYACTCPSGYTGDGRGGSGCLWDDPSLVSLAPDSGVLSPTFDPAMLGYTLDVTSAPEAWAIRLVATVAEPSRATITIDGVPVASGRPHWLTFDTFAPVTVDVVVETESGATRTYTLGLPQMPSPPSPVYVKASNTDADDGFGTSVAVSADGSVVAVGTTAEGSVATGIDGDQTDESAADAGAVYVYRRTAVSWVQDAYVKASNTDAGDLFGGAVALSANGAVLVVGAIEEDSNATGVGGDQADDMATRSGAAYVFRYDGSDWMQEAYLKASNTDIDDEFGRAVDISDDGTTIAVGAHAERSIAAGVGGDQLDNSLARRGAVYVFRRGGTGWTQEAYVKASNPMFSSRFGQALALDESGSLLAVGAPNEDSDATGIGGNQTNSRSLDSGAVYVFRRSSGLWAQEAYVKASNTGSNDTFGSAVALGAGGDVLAVGALGERSSASGIDGDETDDDFFGAGAVYVFRHDAAGWAQEAYVKAVVAQENAFFGQRLGLAADGNVLTVGVPSDSCPAPGIASSGGCSSAGRAILGSGALHVFAYSGFVWRQVAYVKAPVVGAGDAFGSATALSSNGAVLMSTAAGEGSSAIGIDGDMNDNGALLSGAGFIY